MGLQQVCRALRARVHGYGFDLAGDRGIGGVFRHAVDQALCAFGKQGVGAIAHDTDQDFIGVAVVPANPLGGKLSDLVTAEVLVQDHVLRAAGDRRCAVVEHADALFDGPRHKVVHTFRCQ